MHVKKHIKISSLRKNHKNPMKDTTKSEGENKLLAATVFSRRPKSEQGIKWRKASEERRTV